MNIAQVNYQEEIKKCKSMEDVTGKNGLIQRLLKDVIQNMLEGEMAHHLWRDKYERTDEPSENHSAELSLCPEERQTPHSWSFTLLNIPYIPLCWLFESAGVWFPKAPLESPIPPLFLQSTGWYELNSF